jgi:hypothetical protein
MEMTDREYEAFLAKRKEAGRKIDPATAEVTWWHAEGSDPYGVLPEIPSEYWCIGRERFARSSEADGWVNFGDLPEETRNALWERWKRHLSFPNQSQGPFADHALEANV